jgi:hypothetical protein
VLTTVIHQVFGAVDDAKKNKNKKGDALVGGQKRIEMWEGEEEEIREGAKEYIEEVELARRERRKRRQQAKEKRKRDEDRRADEKQRLENERAGLGQGAGGSEEGGEGSRPRRRSKNKRIPKQPKLPKHAASEATSSHGGPNKPTSDAKAEPIHPPHDEPIHPPHDEPNALTNSSHSSSDNIPSVNGNPAEGAQATLQAHPPRHPTHNKLLGNPTTNQQQTSDAQPIFANRGVAEMPTEMRDALFGKLSPPVYMYC